MQLFAYVILLIILLFLIQFFFIFRPSDAVLLISTLDGKFSSLNLETGEENWSHNIGSNPLLSTSSGNVSLATLIAISYLPTALIF